MALTFPPGSGRSQGVLPLRRDGHGVQAQQELQDLHLEVRDADLLRHPVELAEDPLHGLRPVDHPGAGPQLPAGDDGLRRHREVPDLLGQGTLHDVPVKGDGKAVVMVGGKDKGPGVLLAEVQLHIPRRRVGQAVIPVEYSIRPSRQ